MTATLRLVLDQLVDPTEPDLGQATRELARALTATAPAGCDVEGLVSAAPDARAAAGRAAPDLAEVTALGLRRRELAAAWQMGVTAGAAGGMIHSPSLLAPLVRHDRIHDHDQTVVTVWDLRAWESPDELGRTAAMWQRAMLKRAARFADAIVVPTHATARALAERAALGDRIRVIPGAAPQGFRVPSDDVGRRRDLRLPDGYVLIAAARPADLVDAFRAVAQTRADTPVVVLDIAAGEEPAVMAAATSAGLPEHAVHVRGFVDQHDRGAVLGAALVVLAPDTRTSFPWRVLEAMAVGVPIVAVSSPVHDEIVVDGGVLADAADPGALGDALATALGSTAAVERLAVLAADRGRAFTWLGAAERVWQLHADL
ncbi:glycosyltransferase [Microbacterium sp. bgisy189]|uniref:glycosyltransferase n=1 Tax=Microbacterium sp. bgisy189 TaxID=3413798 RepID=UPI003EBA02A5